MSSLVLLFLLFVFLYVLLYAFSDKLSEQFLPFYSSPPKRWGGRDLRCYPYIPKRVFPWNNSSYNYYYRSRCLLG